MPHLARKHRHPDMETLELVGGREKRNLTLAEADPTWPRLFAQHRERIEAAISDTAVTVEHIGSTSVPGLAAKPIIDVLIVVPDITAEEDYLPQLIDAGYVLRVREPGHRMVRTPERDAHLHILEVGDEEIDEYLLLRDHLRRDAADRQLYEDTKRRLLEQSWDDMNDYADAKTAVIVQIKGRARVRGEGRSE